MPFVVTVVRKFVTIRFQGLAIAFDEGSQRAHLRCDLFLPKVFVPCPLIFNLEPHPRPLHIPNLNTESPDPKPQCP